MTVEITGQIIGFVAMALIILSFQIKDPKKMILVQSAAQLLFTVHYFMIGSPSGALQNAVSVIRAICLISSFKPLKSKAAKWVFIAAYMLMPIITMNSPTDFIPFLPGIGMAINTYCLWDMNSRRHRMSQLFIVSPLWIAYNIFNLSYAGILTEVFNASSSLVFLLRTHAFSRNKGEQK